MYVCNTTYNVADEIAKEWALWMKLSFIPLISETGMAKPVLYQVLVEEELGGQTFALMLSFKDKATYDSFEVNYLMRFDEIMLTRFGEKCLKFRTFLSEV